MMTNYVQDCSCVSSSDPNSPPTLALNVVVQNFSTTPVSVNPLDATLVLRTGTSTPPPNVENLYLYPPK